MSTITYFAGIDLGFVSDSSAIVIAGAAGDRVGVVDILELKPERGKPLVPSAVIDAFAVVAKRYDVKSLIADGFNIESAREHARANDMRIEAAPSGQQGKVEAHLRVRELLNAGRVVLPRHPRLIAQLKGLIAKPTAGGGLAITSPRRGGAGHGDVASAAILALWRASQPKPAPILPPSARFDTYRWAGMPGRGF